MSQKKIQFICLDAYRFEKANVFVWREKSEKPPKEYYWITPSTFRRIQQAQQKLFDSKDNEDQP